MPQTFWIYMLDAGRWLPALALPIGSSEQADRIVAMLRAEFPEVEFRIEVDGVR